MTKEQINKLAILLNTPEGQPVGDMMLGDARSMRASTLVKRLSAAIAWNELQFPAFDLASGALHIVCPPDAPDSLQALYIVNQSKTTILRGHHSAALIPNVYIVNCADATIYVAGPVKNVSIVGCTDCEIILMAVTGSAVVNYSDKVVVRAVAANLRLENSTDCQAYVYTSRGIILAGDTRGIMLAPFNVSYSHHHSILSTRTSLHPDSSHATLWSQPICSTLSDTPYMLLAPDKFRLVAFPEFQPHRAQRLAVCLPQVYADALSHKMKTLLDLKNEILEVADEANAQKVNAVISGHFREWVSSHNKAKVMVDLIKQAHDNQ